MNILIMFVIAAVMTFEYLTRIGVLPFVAKYVPDILSAFVLLLVVLHGTRNRFQHLRAAYWFAFGALALTMVGGALANSLQPVPLFFMPAVYMLSEWDIRTTFRSVRPRQSRSASGTSRAPLRHIACG